MPMRDIYDELSRALALIQQFSFSTKDPNNPIEVHLQFTGKLLSALKLLDNVPAFKKLASRARENPIVKDRWQDEDIVLHLGFLGAGAQTQVFNLIKVRDELLQGLTITTQILSNLLSPPIGRNGFIIAFPDNIAIDHLSRSL